MPLLHLAEHETRSAHRAGRDQAPEPEAKRRSALMTQVNFARKRKSRPEIALPFRLWRARHSKVTGAELR